MVSLVEWNRQGYGLVTSFIWNGMSYQTILCGKVGWKKQCNKMKLINNDRHSYNKKYIS